MVILAVGATVDFHLAACAHVPTELNASAEMRARCFKCRRPLESIPFGRSIRLFSELLAVLRHMRSLKHPYSGAKGSASRGGGGDGATHRATLGQGGRLPGHHPTIAGTSNFLNWCDRVRFLNISGRLRITCCAGLDPAKVWLRRQNLPLRRGSLSFHRCPFFGHSLMLIAFCVWADD
jgi:hypothetical protein